MGPVTTIEIPPMSARAFAAHTGERICVCDLEGGQPGDLVAFCLDDPAEHFSQARTRVENRSCRLTAGGRLWSNAMPPRIMLSVTDDTSGNHDLLYTPCSRWVLEQRFDVSRDGCLEHLADALSPWGIAVAAVPDPLNLFFHVGVDADGTMSILPHRSRAGAIIEFKAEVDCLLAVSTCAVPRADGPNTGYRIEVVRDDRDLGSTGR